MNLPFLAAWILLGLTWLTAALRQFLWPASATAKRVERALLSAVVLGFATSFLPGWEPRPLGNWGSTVYLSGLLLLVFAGILSVTAFVKRQW
jgi:hypothetical protein